MLNKTISNAILDSMFGRNPALGVNISASSWTKIINAQNGMWLGLSTTTPVISESGITGFTEPTDNEYKRFLVGGGALLKNAWYMDEASGGIIKNGKQILFPAATREQDGGTGYGTITHFGIFESETGGSPIYVGHLSEVKEGKIVDTSITVAAGEVPVFYKDTLILGLDVTEQDIIAEGKKTATTE